MTSMKILLSLSCAAMFAGCASTKQAPPPAPAPRTLASFLEQADAAIKLGKNEDAVAVLKTAASTWPADKTAWLRIAQVSFDCQQYGEAITHAKKVLERDPDDVVAHSLVAVSGLRVSSKALADLTTKKKVTGDVRDAAQDLAKILRTSINGDIIPAPARTKNHVLKVGVAPPPPPPPLPLPAAMKSSTQLLVDALNQPNDSVKK